MDDTDRKELRAALQHLNRIIERAYAKGFDVKLDTHEDTRFISAATLRGRPGRTIVTASVVEHIGEGA